MTAPTSGSTSSRQALEAALRSASAEQPKTIDLLLVGGDSHGSGIPELLRKYDRINFVTDSVTSADEALSAIEDQGFDVVLLDDSMEADQRLDLIGRVTASPENPPVIALAANADNEFARQAIEAGACQVVRKSSTGYLTLGRTIHQALLSYHRGDEERRLTVEVERLAVVDGLTGLHSQHFLAESLDRECRRAQRYGNALSLLILDIDDFSSCNEAHGRRAGDRLLKEVGQLLKRSVRETDVAARLDGDQFCLLVPETDFDGAMRLGERLRFEVPYRRLAPAEGAETITVSVGVFAPRREQDLKPDYIIARAQEAVKAAKKAGKNKVKGYRSPSPPTSPQPEPEPELAG